MRVDPPGLAAALALALALAFGCGDRRSSPAARDAAPALAGPVRFAWPAPASAEVRQRIVIPVGIDASFTYDLSVERRDGGGLTLTLSDFRDPIIDGAPSKLRMLPLRSHQPLMDHAVANNRLRLDVGDDGAMIGTTALDEMRAKLRSPPPGTEAVVAAAKPILDSPVIEDAVAGHAADLWITWAWLWDELGELPAPGAERTATLFGLQVAVRNLGAGTAPGTVRVEARTVREGVTETDLSGGRAWFVAVGPRSPIDLETEFHLVLTGEIELATLRPHHVALDIEERMVGRAGKPRRWRFEYAFTW